MGCTFLDMTSLQMEVRVPINDSVPWFDVYRITNPYSRLRKYSANSLIEPYFYVTHPLNIHRRIAQNTLPDNSQIISNRMDPVWTETMRQCLLGMLTFIDSENSQTSLIARTLGSMPIRYRSNARVSDHHLIDIEGLCCLAFLNYSTSY